MTDTQAPSRPTAVRSTLLHRPPVPAGAIERTDLLARLDHGLGRSATLVAAPAGYGKTVLASQWCQRLQRPAAWISLAAPADSLREFLRYVAAAVDGVQADSMVSTTQLVAREDDPSAELAVTAVSNDLVALAAPVVIVLDDYHSVSAQGVHELMSEVLRHPPATAHFVILTRRDPPLSVGALRASGQLNELRMEDLRFDIDESARLVGTELGRALDPTERAALDASTEGWAAGLRLAVHAMRHDASTGAAFGAAYLDRGAQEYLIGEVLDHLPPEMLPFLVGVSYFDKFSARLCDAVVNAGDPDPQLSGREFIDWLQRENLFVIPLDDDGSWYRLHHVFRRLLTDWRTSRGGDIGLEEADLHRAAARLLSEQGLVEEAIRELVLADDEEAIVAEATSHGSALVNQDRWGDLATLLAAVPPALLEQRAALSSLQAWLVGEHGGRYQEMNDLVERTEGLLAQRDAGNPATDEIRGQLAVLRGTYARLNTGDLDGALHEARQARQLLATSPARILAQAYALESLALANSGKYIEARKIVDAAGADDRFAHWPMDPMIWTRPLVAWVEGSLDLVQRTGRQLLDAGERYEQRAFIAYGRYFLGAAAYEANHLDTAREHLAVSVDVDFTINELFLHSGIALAFTELASGRPDEALRVSETLLHKMMDTRGDYNVPTAEAAMALLEARTGAHPAALRWARAATADVPRHRYMFFDRTPALVEILLASDSEVAQGRELLTRALETSYGRCNRPVNIKLLALEAIDAARCGDERRARSTLELAVHRAREGGLVRSLADLGPELVPLLHRLEVTGADLEHTGAILTAIEDRSTSDPAGVLVEANVAGESGLTEREADVLRLLAERYSNKEISRALLIAPATVKKHTVTLYDKLNVHSRREAVDKARALGYIRG